MVVMNLIKDIQNRSLPPQAEREKEGGAYGKSSF